MLKRTILQTYQAPCQVLSTVPKDLILLAQIRGFESPKTCNHQTSSRVLLPYFTRLHISIVQWTPASYISI